MAAANDEDYALQLHKQLNAIPLRTRRGQDLTAQQSLDRLKRDKAGKSRTKRTNSSSQEHPSSKKRRTSDPDDGHTSAQQRIKREPTESNHSHPGFDEQQGQHQQPKRQQEHRSKPCDSRDSGMQGGQQQQQQRRQELVPLEDHHLSPAQSAAAAAAATTKQLVKQQTPPDSEVPSRVKVFYAGVRWGLSLQPSAVRSRQLLAKALNDAYVGQILSVGQGECLSVVFLDVNGAAAELGPVKWCNSKANSARWKTLAKTAARIYVRGPEAALHSSQP